MSELKKEVAMEMLKVFLESYLKSPSRSGIKNFMTSAIVDAKQIAEIFCQEFEENGKGVKTETKPEPKIELRLGSDGKPLGNPPTKRKSVEEDFSLPVE